MNTQIQQDRAIFGAGHRREWLVEHPYSAIILHGYQGSVVLIYRGCVYGAHLDLQLVIVIICRADNHGSPLQLFV